MQTLAMDGAEQLFGGLEAEERREILTLTRRRVYRPGEFIMRQGEPGDTVHVIDIGHAAAQVTTVDGVVATLNLLGPGDVVGELALVERNGTRSASIVAIDKVETLSLHRDAFEERRARRPQVDRFLVRLLAGNVRRLSELLRDAYIADAETRVYRRLHALALAFRDTGPPIVVPVDQATLAGLAGASRQTANKALRAAEDAGWVVLARKRVEVCDLEGLAARAEMLG